MKFFFRRHESVKACPAGECAGRLLSGSQSDSSVNFKYAVGCGGLEAGAPPRQRHAVLPYIDADPHWTVHVIKIRDY